MMDDTVRVDLALVHYPVLNRNGEVIGSAVTNLDLHDIARAGRTFGVNTYYLVVPWEDQRTLVAEILAHWSTGHGAGHNPDRREALARIRVCRDLNELYDEVENKWKERPRVLATSAGSGGVPLGYPEVRRNIAAGQPHLLLFGTGWGLAPEVMAGVDGYLPAIRGAGNYNHLSVRSAAAIILDRLLGPGWEE